MSTQDRIDHVAKVDAQIFGFATLVDDQIGGHPNERFVDQQTPRPERHECMGFDTAIVLQLAGLAHARRHVLRTEHGGQVQVFLRYGRQQARVPRAKIIAWT